MSIDKHLEDQQNSIKSLLEKVRRESQRKRKPRPSRVKYRPAIISYIDVLGFKKHIAERKPSEILRLLRVFWKRFGPDEHETKAIALRGINFSDLIIRVTFVPDDPHGTGHDGYVFWELFGLVLAQIELLFERILVRGAVTIGDVYCSQGTIFGPGLVSAYQMEQTAVYPRIVVSKDLLKAATRAPFRKREHGPAEELKYIADLVQPQSPTVLHKGYRAAQSDSNGSKSSTGVHRRDDDSRIRVATGGGHRHWS